MKIIICHECQKQVKYYRTRYIKDDNVVFKFDQQNFIKAVQVNDLGVDLCFDCYIKGK